MAMAHERGRLIHQRVAGLQYAEEHLEIAAAIGSVVVLIVPGIALLRQQPSAVV